MFKKEPVAVSAAISVAIKAVLLATMAFGLNMTSDQLTAVMFAADSLLALFAIFVVRNQVTSQPQVNALIRTAVQQPENTSVEKVKEIQAEKDAA